MAVPPLLLSSLPSLLVVLALLSSLLLAGRKARGGSATWKLPPSPPKLPVIGHLHLLGSSLLHRSLWELSKKHGPLMHLKLGRVPVVVVSSPEMAKEVLKTHDLECCSRPSPLSFSKFSYGFSDVSLTPYGERWRQLRKFCTVELFSARKINSFRDIRKEEMERVTKLICSHARASTMVNLSELLRSLSCNMTCRTAFGSGFDDGGDIQLHDMLREAQAVVGGLFLSDYLPLLGWVDRLSGMRSRLERAYLKLDSIYQRHIDYHQDRLRQQGKEDGDVLDALLRMQKDEEGLTEDHIKGVLMNIFFGGTDTTSATVEWAMAELIRQPELMKRAQDEVRGCVGSKGEVEESDLHQLHFLKCVIKETMRLHPPAPLLLPRETMQHFKLNGYDILPKTWMYVNAWAIGRDPNSWGRPHVFDPERFMHDSMEANGQDFKLIPFGEGRRICPGKNLGMLMVELVLANLVYSFDWHLPPGMVKEDISMEEARGGTVHREYALCLMVTKYDATTA
ncbi:cytochrome P450 71A1-like [Musa acuminata AAA Group]|uniref:cytochrome P450 71A1-like n=1 Tax=Musa acuminata AAA Group TaxID=214697 RepID=UPI0031D6B138